ncbi:hypothetical protein H5410_019272 [Solanum commersonii]|uniref:Ubiquitin-like protease family profile domain-containing protein n=1 Tax=Solanum commersonii TaxID=4109 RepID=A0A9J6A4Z5_SOLCO|nr:hypothetical protein H5410_019272 [Solanum commersonii]
MEQGPSNSVGVSDDEKLAKNRSKRLHDPLAMKDKIVVKPKKRLEKPRQKKGRKVTYVVSRPTLSKFDIKEITIVTGLKCKGNMANFSYPKSTLSRLLQRQDFNQSKQMYRLFGMPYALNVWTYEYTSSLNPDIIVKVANGIPRTCNWTAVANACSNIVPTQDEVEALDLPDIQDVHTPEPSTTTMLPNKVQTRASTSGFEDFSISPPGHLLRKSSRANHFEMMNSRNREDDKQPKNLGSKSTSCIVEVSGKEGNDENQTSTSKFDQQPTSPIQMNFAINDQDICVSDFDVEDQTEDTLKNHQEMKEVSELQSSDANVHHTAEATKHKKILLSSQLSTDIPITKIIVRSDTNTPLARIRMPSKICKSPYLTSFGPNEKGKEVMEDVIRLNFPFEGCWITNQAPSYLIDEFIEWVTTEKERDFLIYLLDPTQEHIDRAVAVPVHERSITNVMKGFSIPASLPWHLMDYVYILVNCDGQFHWVLAVVELNQRLIRVHDSSIGTRKQVHYEEIKKLSRMVPSYLLDSGFFEKTERTIWPELDA